MMCERKRIKYFIDEAWNGSKVINKSVKEIVRKLREVLRKESKNTEKKIEATPYDFLREELSVKKMKIDGIAEDINYLIERDDILREISDLEIQIESLEKRVGLVESVDDLIKTNLVTLEKLRKKEKTITLDRENLLKTSFREKRFVIVDKLYKKILLTRLVREEEWTLYNIVTQAAADSEKYHAPILFDYIRSAIIDSLPKMFSLDKVADMIKHAIRCESDKVFQIPWWGKDPTMLVGAKSRNVAIYEAVANRLHMAQAEGEEWLINMIGLGSSVDECFWNENDDFIEELAEEVSPHLIENNWQFIDGSIVGSPTDEDFLENNEDLIRSLKISISDAIEKK